jgi:hypothetical protein
MLISQSSHRQTLIDMLLESIRKYSSDEGVSFPVASTRVLIDSLGFDLEEVTFIDSRDRGIDAWLATESGIDLFQVKTHELTNDELID